MVSKALPARNTINPLYLKIEYLKEINRIWGKVAVYLNKNRKLETMVFEDLKKKVEDEIKDELE